MKKMILILMVLLISLLLFGCINQTEIEENENEEKLNVMASFFPFYDIAKNVAGESANVSVLVPPASEPHSFNPSPQDILRVSNADIFIVTGTEFEEWEERIVKNVNPNAVVVKASEGLTLLLAEYEHSHSHGHEHDEKDHHDENDHHEDEHVEHSHEYLEEECIEHGGNWIDEHEECEYISKELCEKLDGEFKECESACRHEPEAEICIDVCVAVCSFEEHHEYEHADDHEHSHGLYDPHFWMSPKNVIEITNTITNALAKADPENASYYITNANTYKQKLLELHNDFEVGLANCEKDEIITTHAAFAYLGRDYGFEQIPIFGLSPDHEPSPSQIIKLIEEAKHHGIKHIFYEELVDPRVAQTIASEVGAEVLVLNNIEGSKDGKGYIELMTQNLDNLKIALQCE